MDRKRHTPWGGPGARLPAPETQEELKWLH